MKILYVVHGYPPKRMAGTEIYTKYLSEELGKKHDVHVVYPVYDPKVSSIHTESKFSNKVNVHEIILPYTLVDSLVNCISFNSTYINKKIEKPFEQILNECAPDIVHIQHLIGLSVSLVDIIKNYNISTVLTLHDYWFMCPNIQLLKWNFSVCEKPEPRECQKCWINNKIKRITPSLKVGPSLTITKKTLNHVYRIINPSRKFSKRNMCLKSLLLKIDKMISPSRFLKKKFIEYGIPEEKIIYSENGYNFDVFSNFKKVNNKSKIVFGFVGSVIPSKGVHVLVDAFTKISEDRAELRIFGQYNPNLKYVKNIMKIVAKKDNIKFIGKFKDVRRPYSEIDVLIFPSIWYENCPLVLAEARITKTPVIASNIGAVPEYVKDKKTGMLFKLGDPLDLYNKITKVIENPEVIDVYRKSIKPPRDIKEQAREIEKIYRKLK